MDGINPLDFYCDKEFYEKSQQQMFYYSPTPRIKIIKWYSQICNACVHVTHDFGEYDCVGWYECDESHRLGNLKSFPNCDAKSCDKFNPTRVMKFDDDYWTQLMDFDKHFDDGYKKLWVLLDFNERMGDYKIGRIK